MYKEARPVEVGSHLLHYTFLDALLMQAHI